MGLRCRRWAGPTGKRRGLGPGQSAAVTGALGPGGGQPRTTGRRRVLRHDRWAQGQEGDGSRVTLASAGAGDAGVRGARLWGVPCSARRARGAKGLGRGVGAVAGQGGRAAGEHSPGTLLRQHLRSGAVSRDGMDLREGNGAHRQSAETFRAPIAHIPLGGGTGAANLGSLWHRGYARVSRLLRGQTPAESLALDGSREFGTNNWILFSRLAWLPQPNPLLWVLTHFIPDPKGTQ